MAFDVNAASCPLSVNPHIKPEGNGNGHDDAKSRIGQAQDGRSAFWMHVVSIRTCP